MLHLGNSYFGMHQSFWTICITSVPQECKTMIEANPRYKLYGVTRIRRDTRTKMRLCHQGDEYVNSGYCIFISMLERFARGKHFTQGNPLLAVVILRMKRKFSMNFTTSLMYCKTTFPAHIPVKDRLRGKGEIIPWLKAPISRQCAFVSHPCTHMTINVRCQQCSPHYQTSPSEQRSQGGSQGNQAALST